MVSTLDTYSSKTIVELSDGVKFLVKNFENITSKAETSAETVAQYNREFISGAGDIEKNINELFDKLLPRINEIKSTTRYFARNFGQQQSQHFAGQRVVDAV